MPFVLLSLALLSGSSAQDLPSPGIPRAIYADPPADLQHPATTLSVEIPSHGAVMNGIVYRPSGPGPFPLVVFVHGLPGNEQHLDLAQAMRRAGWAVLTFHYRGAFGSEGVFSVGHTEEDADVAIAYARTSATAWSIDPARIVVMGHSLGGLAAAHAARGAPDRLATVLLAPWDPSVLATILRSKSPAEREAFALERWGDVSHGRLRGTTAFAIGREVLGHGDRYELAREAGPISTKPLLIVTARRDLPSSQAGTLEAALAHTGTKMDMVEIDSNHSFDDHRIALQVTVLNWLAGLPGAPIQR